MVKHADTITPRQSADRPAGQSPRGICATLRLAPFRSFLLTQVPIRFGPHGNSESMGAERGCVLPLTSPMRHDDRDEPARTRGRLKIGDDWNAITIIALSQSSPLKAIAELVENSIDAKARTVTITRGREHRRHFLSIR